MKIWYRVDGNNIEPVRVVRENASTVVVARKRFSLEAAAPTEWLERRHNKISQWDCYFPTLQQAIDHMQSEAAARVADAERELQRERERFERVTAYLAKVQETMSTPTE